MESGDNASSGLTDFGTETDGTLTGGQPLFMGSEHSGDIDDSLGGEDPSENEGQSDGGGGGRKEQALREQDRFLPIANVSRIMKVSIPKTGKIAKDAKECVQECVSEFVSFITSEASDRCHAEKRKTINGEDILHAMQVLGFDNYVPPLKLYLNKYREAQKGDKPNSSMVSGYTADHQQLEEVIRTEVSLNPDANQTLKLEGYPDLFLTLPPTSGSNSFNTSSQS